MIEANLSSVTINQCEISDRSYDAFNGTHKCHRTTYCVYKEGGRPFAAGNYWCKCKPGYYSLYYKWFDGILVEGIVTYKIVIFVMYIILSVSDIIILTHIILRFCSGFIKRNPRPVFV